MMRLWTGSGCAWTVCMNSTTHDPQKRTSAGSVVTKDIPANVVAVGNPCRVLRPISDRDKKYYFRDHPIDHAQIAQDLKKNK